MFCPNIFSSIVKNSPITLFPFTSASNSASWKGKRWGLCNYNHRYHLQPLKLISAYKGIQIGKSFKWCRGTQHPKKWKENPFLLLWCSFNQNFWSGCFLTQSVCDVSRLKTLRFLTSDPGDFRGSLVRNNQFLTWQFVRRAFQRHQQLRWSHTSQRPFDPGRIFAKWLQNFDSTIFTIKVKMVTYDIYLIPLGSFDPKVQIKSCGRYVNNHEKMYTKETSSSSHSQLWLTTNPLLPDSNPIKAINSYSCLTQDNFPSPTMNP